MSFVVGLIALFFIVQAFKRHGLNKRRKALLAKYADEEVVRRIMSRSFWQGQTDDQLRDSLGEPLDVETKVMKTRRREIWKYRELGRNRYGLRITLDNHLVVGWDQK